MACDQVKYDLVGNISRKHFKVKYSPYKTYVTTEKDNVSFEYCPCLLAQVY